jgi:hypothetical protein
MRFATFLLIKTAHREKWGRTGTEVLSRKASRDEIQYLLLTWEANSIAANYRKRESCEPTKGTRTSSE